MATVQTAIGVRHTHVRQRSMGFRGGSFNTREFFHGKAPVVLTFARWSFVLLVFVIPVVLLAIAFFTESEMLPLGAFVAQYTGLLFERWYFFAEAQHPQNLYYQSVA